MPLYSHSQRREKGSERRVGSRTMREHTGGVVAIAAERFRDGVDFGPVPGVTDGRGWAWLLGEVTRLHDLGKLTDYFQRYLLKAKPKVSTLADEDAFDERDLRGHTHFGAFQAWARHRGASEWAAYLIAYLIAHHHRSLGQPGLVDDPLNISEPGALKRRIGITERQAAALPPIEKVRRVLGVADLEIVARPVTHQDDAWDINDAAKQWKDRSRSRLAGAARGLETFFATNYLFSLLVEADKLDASGTATYAPRGADPTLVDAHLGRPKGGAVARPSVGRDLSTLGRDERRHQARAEVLDRLVRIDIERDRLFTLTGPTGIGKTFTGLHAALELRDRLTRERQLSDASAHPPQIIVALPFVNIIEQTLIDYREVFAGTDVRVVGHYQFADVLGQADADALAEGREGEDSRHYDRARMALDTWQADVVVTSFVQLFQSIATGRNAALKKFNHLAGAILVLDEVQGLPIDLAPFVGTLLVYCARCLGTRVLMMTATQPRFMAQASEVMRNGKVAAYEVAPIELLARYREYYALLARTQLRFELARPFVGQPAEDDAGEAAASAESLFVERFSEVWTGTESQLVVVNTVNRSLAVYRALAEAFADAIVDGEVRLFYLSTNVLPVQRETRIGEVKAALNAFRQNGRDVRRAPAVVLVATQVVEAGVDLDFDRGWRDFAPVSSLVQVAGRVNRNGALGRVAEVHVVSFGESRPYGTGPRYDAEGVYGFQLVNATHATLERLATDLGERRGATVTVPEARYGALTDEYFSAVNPGRAGVYATSQGLFVAAECLDYEKLETFRLIDERNRIVQVFVPWDPPGEGGVAAAALEAYRHLLTARVDPETRRELRDGFEAAHGTALRKRLLNVPERYATEVVDLVPGSEIKRLPLELLGIRYEDATGWVRDADTDQLLIL